MTGRVLRTQSGGVLTFTLDNPESRNALTLEMSGALCEMLREAALDGAVRVVVLTGSGQAFCAGGDVKAMAAGRDAGLSLEERAARLRDRAELSRLLHEMDKPTVAVMPGAAAGAGLAIALACDFRVASSEAKLSTAFARVGLAGDFGATWFLTQMLGTARARELLMFAPTLTAQQAFEMGLVTRVFPHDRFAALASEFVGELADGPTRAFAHAKQTINVCAANALAPSLDIEALRQARCMTTEDHANAATAFAEKRRASFIGR